MSEVDPRVFKFGPFHIDTEQRVLFRDGAAVPLTQKAFDTLAILIGRQGKIVDKAELIKLVWPETFVEENNLTQNISTLRKILGEGEYIETIPRRGYRFITPVGARPPDSSGSQIPSLPNGLAANGVPAPDSTPRKSRWRLEPPVGTLMIAVAAIIAIALAFARFRERSPDEVVVRSSIPPPEKTAFSSPVAISPDGRRLAFGASTADGKNQLWVRSLDTLLAQPLADTEGAAHPFWSPDSRFLGFFADGKLERIDASGGPAFTLCAAPNGAGGTWSRNGIIVFAPGNREPLSQVSAAGGVPTPVTTLDRSRAETTHRWPWFLPDERHFLFVAGNTASGSAIRVGSVDSNRGDSKVLVESMFNAVYSQGYLLFLREGTLMAQPLDTKRLVTTADAVPLAEQIQAPRGLLRGVFSVSATGMLVYRSGGRIAGDQLAWLDRSGKQIVRLGGPGLFSNVHLSPDGKSAAVATFDPATHNRDVWLYDVARGLRTRFTSDPAEERESTWSPDGRTIVFMSNRRGHFDLFEKSSAGGRNEDLLFASDVDKYPSSFSPDGKSLLYWTQGDPKTASHHWVLPMTGERKPYPFAQTLFREDFGKFAPDGRWIAYASDESEREEIYVAPFPGPGDRRRISIAGGGQPRWRRDGKEIFYLAADKRVMSAEVKVVSGVLEVGAVRPLFGPVVCGGGSCFDVSTDGQRFLVRTEPEQITSESLTLVQHWTAALRR
jgi:eukaryotic-like serine/threonine-protein kinase